MTIDVDLSKIPEMTPAEKRAAIKRAEASEMATIRQLLTGQLRDSVRRELEERIEYLESR